MIYSAISAALRDARCLASSQTQLKMLDLVAGMIGDELGQFNGFRRDIFLDECQVGYGVFIDNNVQQIWREE